MLTSMIFAASLLAADQAQPAPDAGADEVDPRALYSKEATEVESTKRVCRTIRMTGTRVPKKVCRVQSEWQAQTDNHRDAMDDLKATGVGVDINRGTGRPAEYANQQSQPIAPTGPSGKGPQ